MNKDIILLCALTGATSIAQTPGLGEIVAVNSAQNYAASLAQDVVGYLAGLPSPDESALLDLLAPPVLTGDFYQFAKADDEAFLTESDDSDIRGIGATFKRVEYRGTTVTDFTQQKGLMQRVDHRTLPRVNGTILPGWENRTAASLRNRLIRADLVRALAVIDAAANSGGTKTWDATGNPDKNLRDMAEATRTKTGMRATHLVLGTGAHLLRKDSYEAAARANHAMAMKADYTLEQIAAAANVDRAVLANAIKQAKKGATKASVLDLVAYSYTAMANATIDDPSNVKRAYSPTMSGGQWAVFIQEGAAWTDITVFQQSKIFVPQSTGIEKIIVQA